MGKAGLKALLSLLFSVLFAAKGVAFAAAQEPLASIEVPDSASLARLDGMLEEFYSLLTSESDEKKKCAEMDNLISSCVKGPLRDHVAGRILAHYMDSPLMGEESVALHIYDRWFASGEADFPDEASRFEAELFQTFNRLSMLYMDAPHLRLRTPSGLKRNFPSGHHLEILCFYDTQCAKCKATSALLPYSLQSYFEAHPDSQSGILRLSMIYTGSDRSEWKKFRESFRVEGIRVRHAWDPEIESDYQKKYGVTGTPRLFVISPEGMIIGRRLENDSLLEVLDFYYIYRNYE